MSASTPLSGRRTPLGRPVVPEVYIINDPAGVSSGSVPGWPSVSAPHGSAPCAGVPSTTTSGSVPAARAAATEASSARGEHTTTWAPLSARM